MNREKSGLLELLQERKAWTGYDERRAQDLPVYAVPARTEAQMSSVFAAARDHAAVNASDPFAHGRMLCHLTRGLDEPGAVAKAAKSAMEARRLAVPV
jgi:hypothetical protein